MRQVAATITIQAPPIQILDAFLEPSMLREWWGVERALIERRAGGLYTLAWQVNDSGIRFVTTGIVEHYDPAAGELRLGHLVYLNPARPILGPMNFRVTATPGPEGTELSILQGGYGEGPDWDWYYGVVREAWPMVLQVIKAYLERSTEAVPAAMRHWNE